MIVFLSTPVTWNDRDATSEVDAGCFTIQLKERGKGRMNSIHLDTTREREREGGRERGECNAAPYRGEGSSSLSRQVRSTGTGIAEITNPSCFFFFLVWFGLVPFVFLFFLYSLFFIYLSWLEIQIKRNLNKIK